MGMVGALIVASTLVIVNRPLWSAAPSASDCRYLILGPGDGIYDSGRSQLLVEIAGTMIDIDPVRHTWFGLGPEIRRTATVFVMKSLPPGSYTIRIQSNWPLGKSGLSGEHEHVGQLMLDSDHIYYWANAAQAYGDVQLGVSMRQIKAIETENLDTYLNFYSLSKPTKCAWVAEGVSVVD
jgi:hypothetical protein